MRKYLPFFLCFLLVGACSWLPDLPPLPPEPVPTPTPTPTPEPCPPAEPTEPCEGEWFWHSQHPHDSCEGEWVCVLPEPEPTPTPEWPTWQTMPYRWEVKLKKQGKKRVNMTIVGDFGKLEGGEYYKDIWPERYAEGKTWGPLAPDGHPERLAREAAFMEQPCPEWFAYDEVPSGSPPYNFDPWFVQGGENQNHWRNVEAGCGTWKEPHESWVYWPGTLKVKSGMFWAFTVHGNLKVKACIGNGGHCTISRFRIDF